MQALNVSFPSGRRARRWLFAGFLLMSLAVPATVLAGPPQPDYVGPDTCAQCHPEEATIWHSSPHARALDIIYQSLPTTAGDQRSLEDLECLSCHATHLAPGEDLKAHTGVTCEACHGPYVQNHPQDGVMQLQVDASTCRECHTVTYQEWHETGHAEAGVQCTGCHVPHSQESRLPAEALCASCHRDVAVSWSHQNADVGCVDCHFSSHAVVGGVSDVRVTGPGAAADHSVGLPVQACADCHRQSIHVADVQASQIDCEQIPAMTARAQQLAGELEDAERTNRTLRTMSVVSLGLGLGVGGVLGIIFVLVVGYIARGRANE